MSHTNSTANYNLPQFITTDKPAWLTDVNNAYAAIDLGIHAAKSAGDNAQADATQALSDASAAGTTASTANSKAGGAVASISEDFLDSATYNVGDLVMYNNLLYVCSTAVIVPGPWTGSVNWSRATIDGLIPKNSDFSLAGLSDTTISSPQNNQLIKYNGTKWVNTNIPIRSVMLQGTIRSSYADGSTLGVRNLLADSVDLTTLNNYPTGKTILSYSIESISIDGTSIGLGSIIGHVLNVNTKISGTADFLIRCI